MIKKSLIIFSLFLFKISLFSQVYVDSLNRTYIDKDQPLYIWISISSSDTSTKYLLKSEKSKKYTNPMYLDTEGYNTLQSPSAVDIKTKNIVYPQEDIIFEIYADSKSPKTKIQYESDFLLKEKYFVFSKTPLVITIDAVDELSGLENTNYSLNRGEYKPYEKPIILTNEGVYQLACYSTDNVGNIEKENVNVIYVDTTGPEIFFRASSSQIGTKENLPVYPKFIIMFVSCSDLHVGYDKMYYSLNNSKMKLFESQIINIPKGLNVIEVKAIDRLGNISFKIFKFWLE